jgi:hypothetical protein
MKKLLGSLSVVIVSSYGAVALAQGANSSTIMGREPTRAEVQADLALWQRAGLPRWTNSNSANTFSPEYNAALAKYIQMKSGPEYQEELRRIEAKSN